MGTLPYPIKTLKCLNNLLQIYSSVERDMAEIFREKQIVMYQSQNYLIYLYHTY